MWKSEIYHYDNNNFFSKEDVSVPIRTLTSDGTSLIILLDGNPSNPLLFNTLSTNSSSIYVVLNFHRGENS